MLQVPPNHPELILLGLQTTHTNRHDSHDAQDEKDAPEHVTLAPTRTPDSSPASP
jgi:hypothetical protein